MTELVEIFTDLILELCIWIWYLLADVFPKWLMQPLQSRSRSEWKWLLQMHSGCKGHEKKYMLLTNFMHNAHTVSFDWVLSGLEWILNLEVFLLKLLTFYQKLLWNIRSRLNSSTFWVFRPVFRYVWSKLKLFAQKNEDFDQTYLNTGSKTQNVEELSLNLIFHNIFWQNIKSFGKQNS